MLSRPATQPRLWTAVVAVWVACGAVDRTGVHYSVDAAAVRLPSSETLSQRREQTSIAKSFQTTTGLQLQPHPKEVWGIIVRAAQHDALKCQPNEIDSQRHCICPTDGHCTGTACVTGHTLNGTTVEGYKKG